MVGRRLFTAIIAALYIAPSAHASEVPKSRSIDITPETSRADEIKEGLGPKTVPHAYIIQLDSKVSSNEPLHALHERFYKRAEEEKIDYKIRHEFKDASLFFGLSIELRDGVEKDVLERIPEVKGVWPVLEIPRPGPVGLQGQDVKGFKGAANGSNNNIIRGKDYKIDFNLKLAGIDRLHSQGVKGKGVKIATIDTGIDYNHVALGGGFGPGKKVTFGRNYIDDGQGGPDDPIATCSDGGHGTHVAGIIIGDDPEDEGFGLLGVAPEASLGMYRVFGCTGGAYLDTIMSAFIDATNDGADIISMSLGFSSGFESDDPFAQATSNAKDRGVAVIAAVGNDGAFIPFSTSSPAIGKDVVAVASVDAARYPTTYKVGSNRGGEWRYASLWPLEGEFTVYVPPTPMPPEEDCPWTGPEDSVPEIEKNGWDIGKTLFMLRHTGSGCNVGANLESARISGYKAVLLWKDHEDENPYYNNYYESAPPFNSISVDHIDGPKLVDAVTADPLGFRLRFKDRRFLPVDSPSAGFTSNYSTAGNTWEFNVFKPLLAAPGHLILSTWPLEAGGYAIISGTSMATPFVAGSYALLKSAYPKLSVDQITNLFSTTAQPAKWWGNTEVIHSLSHQGAGTIHAWNAYKSGVEFKQGALVLPRSGKPTHLNITLTNTLGRSKSFKISHLPAGIRRTKTYYGLDPVPGIPTLPIYAKIDFEATTITLAAGETAVVSFAVTPPPIEDPALIAQYSGFIKFTSGRDTYTVPYIGLPYSYDDVPIISRDVVRGGQWPALTVGYEGYNPVPARKDVVEYTPDNHWAYLYYYASQPTETTRLDLVAANTTFEATYYGFNRSNHIETSTPPLPIANTFGGAESLFYILEGGRYMPWLGTIAWSIGYQTPEGEWAELPAGDYRLLLRLLPFGREYENAKNWESWLSPVLRLPEPLG